MHPEEIIGVIEKENTNNKGSKWRNVVAFTIAAAIVGYLGYDQKHKTVDTHNKTQTEQSDTMDIDRQK